MDLYVLPAWKLFKVQINCLYCLYDFMKCWSYILVGSHFAMIHQAEKTNSSGQSWWIECTLCVCVIFHQPKIHPSSESFGTGFLKITSLLGVCWSEFRVQNSHTSWHVFGKFVIHLRQLPKCDLILPQPLTSKMIMKSNKEYLRRGMMQLIPLKRYPRWWAS